MPGHRKSSGPPCGIGSQRLKNSGRAPSPFLWGEGKVIDKTSEESLNGGCHLLRRDPDPVVGGRVSKNKPVQSSPGPMLRKQLLDRAGTLVSVLEAVLCRRLCASHAKAFKEPGGAVDQGFKGPAKARRARSPPMGWPHRGRRVEPLHATPSGARAGNVSRAVGGPTRAVAQLQTGAPNLTIDPSRPGAGLKECWIPR